MNKATVGILVIGVIGLVLFGGMAMFVTSTNPKLQLRQEIEEALPVLVDKMAEEEDPSTRNLALTIHGRRREDAPAGAPDARELAVRVAEQASDFLFVTADNVGDDPARKALLHGPRYDVVHVSIEGAREPVVVTRAERNLERTYASRLPGAADKLQKRLGVRPQLTLERVSSLSFAVVATFPPRVPSKGGPLPESELKPIAATLFEMVIGIDHVRVTVEGPAGPTGRFARSDLARPR